MWRRRGTRVVRTGLVCCTVLIAGACSVAPAAPRGAIGDRFDLTGSTLTVGSKSFTEQLVLGELTVQALEAAGATVERRLGVEGSVNVRRLLLSGDVDIYWEYTGTAWELHLGKESSAAAAELFDLVAAEDLTENGVRWLEPAPFDNTYAVAAHPSTGLRTISELGERLASTSDRLRLCASAEFVARDDGLPGLEAAYGFTLPDRDVNVLQRHSIYPMVTTKDGCELASVFATDGRLRDAALTVLVDDRDFFPEYRPAPIVLATTLESVPELSAIFELIAPRLDAATIRDLNAAVDVDGRRPADVAAEWLDAEGLT